MSGGVKVRKEAKPHRVGKVSLVPQGDSRDKADLPSLSVPIIRYLLVIGQGLLPGKCKFQGFPLTPPLLTVSV